MTPDKVETIVAKACRSEALKLKKYLLADCHEVITACLKQKLTIAFILFEQRVQ